MDENRLIEKAICGDKYAFCDLYDIYKDRLYRYAYYKLGNNSDAEDAVSECVLSAWKQIGKLRQKESFPSWIFRILAGCCNRILRDKIRERESIEAVKENYTHVQEADGHAVEIEAALKLLDEDEQEVVLLSVIGGFNSREIAEMSGMTAGSVRSKLSRSLAKMRKYLEV